MLKEYCDFCGEDTGGMFKSSSIDVEILDNELHKRLINEGLLKHSCFKKMCYSACEQCLIRVLVHFDGIKK